MVGRGETLRRSASARWLLLLGLAIASSFASVCGVVLLEMRGRDYEHAKQATANLISSVASDIDRNIELYDLSLQGVVDGLQLPGIDGLSPQMRSAVLFDRATTGADLGSILVLDRTGDVVMDSLSFEPPHANYAERDFFRAHVHTADAGLFIGRPWVGADGQYVISFSRRLAGADGTFAGVVAGSMRLSYFYNLSRRLKFGPVVCLDRLDPERELVQQEVSELDRGLLVEPVVDPQDPQPGAVVDGGELVVLLPAGGAMNLTSIWTWWPGSCFSYRFHRRSFGLYRCEAGSRLRPSRLRIRHTPELLMSMSW